MKGVKFGDKHSYNEWGLVLSSKEIQAPEPKIMQIEVEGGDGVLDLTDFFGEVKYKNRTLSFSFSRPGISPDEYLALFSVMQNAIHGKLMNVILDDDPGNYYRGRVTINEWKSNRNIGEIVIEVDAEPYKYRVDETVVSKVMGGGTSSVILTNGRKRVVPTITTDAETTVSFGTYSGTFSAGTFTIPELQLIEGENIVKVRGTGNISFSYREGAL